MNIDLKKLGALSLINMSDIKEEPEARAEAWMNSPQPLPRASKPEPQKAATK